MQDGCVIMKENRLALGWGNLCLLPWFLCIIFNQLCLNLKLVGLEYINILYPFRSTQAYFIPIIDDFPFQDKLEIL